MDRDQIDQSQKADDLNKLYRQVNNLRNAIVSSRGASGEEFNNAYDKVLQEIKRLEFYLRRFK